MASKVDENDSIGNDFVVDNDAGDDANIDINIKNNNNSNIKSAANNRRSNKASSGCSSYENLVRRFNDDFLVDKIFEPLFLHVAYHPYHYIVIILFISTVLPTISIVTNSIHTILAVGIAGVPPDSYPRRQVNWLEQYFVPVRHSIALLHYEQETDGIMMDSNNNNNNTKKNILTKEAISMAFDISEIIPTLTDFYKLCAPRSVVASGDNHEYTVWNTSSSSNLSSNPLQALEEQVAALLSTSTTSSSYPIRLPCEFYSVALFWPNRSAFEEDTKNLTTPHEQMHYIRQRVSSPTFWNGKPATRPLIFGHYKHATDNSSDHSLAQYEGDDDLIYYAQSLAFTLHIESTVETAKYIEIDFVEKLHQLATSRKEQKQQDNHNGGLFFLKLDLFANAYLDKELKAVIDQDLPLVVIAILVMSIFTACAMMVRSWTTNTTTQQTNNKQRHQHQQQALPTPQSQPLWVTSNFGLGLGATLTVVLSMATGYSFCSLCGYAITNVTQVLPFILIGIGLDDSFVLMGAYYQAISETKTTENAAIKDNTDTEGQHHHNEHEVLPLDILLKKMARQACPSITLTSLTDCAAFALGSTSNIPAIRWFGFYAVVCVTIDFLYQVTFFMALLVLDHRRRENNRYDCLCCCLKTTDTRRRSSENSNEVKNDLIAVVVGSGDVEEVEQEEALHVYDDNGRDKVRSMKAADDLDNNEEMIKTWQRHHSNTNISCHPTQPSSIINNNKNHKEKNENKPTWMRMYGRLLMKPMTKAIVIVVFLSMFVFGAFWASKVKVGIEMTDLTAKNAISDQYWEASQKYFINKDEGYFETRLYYHDLDVSDPNVREQMLSFRYDMLALGSDEYPETRSFLEDLNVFLMEKEQNGMNWMSNVSFSDELDMFFSVKEYRLLYGDAVIRKRKDDDISRYGEIDRLVERLIIGIDLDDTNDEVQFLNEQRRVTLEQPLNENLSDGVERMFLYNDYFDLWEHFRMVPRELIMSLILSLVAVALICSMFLPHVSGTVLSIVSVVFVDVELVGIIVLAGYSINSITMVLLIMSIGLVADYCLHVVHAYFHINADVGDDGIESTEKKKMVMKRDTVVEEGSACIEDSMVEMSNDERVILSLEKIGGSVFLGGFTTFLGILALAFSSGEAFFSFFVVFVSMVVLGLAHGLIFMPVVLSLVVKSRNGDVEKKKKIVSLFPAIVSSSSSLRNDRQRQKEGEGLFKSGCVVVVDADNDGMNAGDDGLAPMNEETEKIVDASGGDSMGDGLLLCEMVSDR